MVIKLVKENWSLGQIADHVGVTKRTVSRIKEKNGLAVPQNTMTPEEVAQVEEWLDEGWSLGEIARTLGRPPGTLSHRFAGRSKWNAAMGQEWRWMNERLRTL